VQYGLKISLITSFKGTHFIEIIPAQQKSNRCIAPAYPVFMVCYNLCVNRSVSYVFLPIWESIESTLLNPCRVGWSWYTVCCPLFPHTKFFFYYSWNGESQLFFTLCSWLWKESKGLEGILNPLDSLAVCPKSVVYNKVLWILFAGLFLSFWSEVHYNSIYPAEGTLFHPGSQSFVSWFSFMQRKEVETKVCWIHNLICYVASYALPESVNFTKKKKKPWFSF
jgi:hypothetical protein